MERSNPARPALKQLATDTPADGVREDKKQRTFLQTPASVLRTPAHVQQPPTAAGACTPASSQNPANGDLLDYLRGRGGRIKELEDDLARCKAANEQLRADAFSNQHALRKLEADLRSAQALSAGAQGSSPMQDTYTQQVEKLLDAELAKSLDLEQQLNDLRRRLSAAEGRAATAEGANRNLKAEADKAARTASLQLASLQRELEVARAEASEAVRKAESRAVIAERRAAAETEMLQTVKAQLAEAERALSARSTDASELRQQLSDHLAKQAALPPPSASLQQRVRELEQQLAHAGASTSRPGLTSSPHGAHSAHARGAAPDAGCKGRGSGGVSEAEQLALPMVAQLRQELGQAQAQLVQWQQLLKVLPGVRTPEAALPVLEGQAAEAEEAKATLRLREEEAVSLRARADATQAEVGALSEKASSSSMKLQAALADVAIAQRKLAVITQERNSLHRALREPPPNSSGGPHSIGAQLAASQAIVRSAQLESQVQTLQQEAERAQEDLAALSKKEAAAQGALMAATSRAESAERRIAQLEKEADGLAQEVGLLQEKLGRGEFSRSGSVRVLHLRMNPETEYQNKARSDELGVLQAENTALKASVSSLSQQLAEQMRKGGSAVAGSGTEAGEAAKGGTASDVSSSAAQPVTCDGDGSGAASSLATLAAKDAEMAVLRHKVTEADKAMVRLREVFKERAAAFREAVQLLFGYRVDMTSEATAARNAGTAPTTLSLRPQHFHEPDAVLVFRLTKERGMELVPTSWTNGKLAREVDTFIKKFRSIPAFTANLTMEGFQKATQC